MSDNGAKPKTALMAALSAGALWGIFESTVGYALHLLPFSVGFLVWYPAACFFLIKSYRESGRAYAILLTSALAAAVKLLNLFLPGRLDKVINPAASIIFEGLSVFTAIFIFNCTKSVFRNKRWGIAVFSLGANSLWRLMYIVYLAAIVPRWIRDASVLRSADTLFRFLAVDNFAGGSVAWLGYLAWKRFGGRTALMGVNVSKTADAGPLGIFILLAADIGLQLLIK